MSFFKTRQRIIFVAFDVSALRRRFINFISKINYFLEYPQDVSYRPTDITYYFNLRAALIDIRRSELVIVATVCIHKITKFAFAR